MFIWQPAAITARWARTLTSVRWDDTPLAISTFLAEYHMAITKVSGGLVSGPMLGVKQNAIGVSRVFVPTRNVRCGIPTTKCGNAFANAGLTEAPVHWSVKKFTHQKTNVGGSHHPLELGYRNNDLVS